MSIKSRIDAAYRDFVTPGVPASGPHDPAKPEIRDILKDMADAAVVAGNVLVFATVALMNAASGPFTTGQRAEVVADPGGNVTNKNGIWRWSGSAWAWLAPLIPSDTAEAVAAARMAASPLRLFPRSGASTAAPQLLPGLLGARVEGAAAGEVWQIAYIAWGFYAPQPHGVTLRTWPSLAAFASNAAFSVAQNFSSTATWTFSSTGTATVRITPTARPEVTVILTIDGSKLPAWGSAPLKATDLADPGSSWLIDPALVFTASGAAADTAAQRSPLRFYPRAGVNTAAPQLFPGLVSARVDGAAGDEVWQVTYIAWGFGAAPQPQGVILRVWPSLAAFIADSTNSSFSVAHNFGDATSWTFNGSGMTTVRITPKNRPEVTVTLTVDGSKLPAWGAAPLKATELTDPGAAYVIDPAFVFGASGGPGPVTAGGGSGAVHWSFNAVSGVLRVSWAHGADQMLRVTIAPQTLNGLPTITGVHTAPLGDPETASWTEVLTNAGGDWFPPLVIRADAGGNGDGVAYTGGNHLSDGGTGGDPTAELEMLTAFASGQPVEMIGDAGLADEVTLSWTARIMGYNTRTTSPRRYIMRQAFTVRITPGSLETLCRCTALELLRVERDNGPQMTTVGFRGETATLHFWGGQQEAAIVDWTSGAQDSGAVSAYPTERILTLGNGDVVMASWIDPVYGAAAEAGSINPTSYPVMYSSGQKTYHQVIRTASAHLTLAPGAAYAWRGGYCFAAPDDAAGDMEAVIRRTRAGETQYCAIFETGGEGMARTDARDVGRPASNGVSVQPEGLAMVRSGYGAVIAELGAVVGLAAKVDQTRSVTGGGLAGGGGSLDADRVITVPKASGEETAAGENDAKAVTPLGLVAARAADRAMVHALAGGFWACPEIADAASAFSARMTRLHAGLFADLVGRVIDAGVWEELALFYVNAMHHEQAARVNLIDPGTYDLTAVNSPAFDAFEGWTGNGSSAYLTAGVGWSTILTDTTDSHFGAWMLTAASNENPVGQASGSSRIVMNPLSSGGSFSGRLGTTGSPVLHPVSTGIGHFAVDRPNGSEIIGYMDGVSGGPVSSTFAETTTGQLTLLRHVGAYATTQMAAFHAGASMDPGLHAALSEALNIYRTSVGALS